MSCLTTSVTQSVVGGEDNQVDFEDIILDAGSFGPFGLVTRHRTGGSIVDANYIFGHITIVEDAKLDSLSVFPSDISIGSIGLEESIDLDFSFSLSVNLWKYDVIVLGIDSKYIASSSPICTSENVYGVENNL